MSKTLKIDLTSVLQLPDKVWKDTKNCRTLEQAKVEIFSPLIDAFANIEISKGTISA
jgi:hypothetical protein